MKNLKNIEDFGDILKTQGYAKKSIEQYKSCIKNLSSYFNIDLSKVYQKDIQIFLVHRIIKENRSFADENQHINAIKLFYKITYGIEIKPYFIKRPKQDKYLPTILTHEQIEQVIFNIPNIKHQAILFTIYDNGLRIGEVLNLTLMDLRTKCENPHIILRNTKNNNNRVLNITEECVELLKEYYLKNRPKYYLFEGAPGKPYSETSIRNILNNALKREGFEHIRVHDLRHAFATHCLEEGTNLKHLSLQLGHKNERTTEKIYCHLQTNRLRINRPGNNKSKIIPLRKVS